MTLVSNDKASGGVMIAALISIAVLAAVAAQVIQRVSLRYNSNFQTASWQEAFTASESAAELGIAAVRLGISDPTEAWAGWTSTDGQGQLLPNNKKLYTPVPIYHAGEGNSRMQLSIEVDAPTSLLDAGGRQWYRIRASGTTDLSGPARVSFDKLDNALRRLSLVRDAKTQQAVDVPKVTRVVEMIAAPVGAAARAITAEDSIKMNTHMVTIDSYHSGDPSRSTNGLYDPAKRQENGDIGTNGQSISAGSAHVYGDAGTNAGSITGGANITGNVANDFYQYLAPVSKPNWTVVDPAPASVTQTMTLAGGATSDAPARYKFNKIDLSGNRVLTLQGATTGSSYLEIWVTGDVRTAGSATVVIEPGAKVAIYVEGNVKLGGGGLVNSSHLAENFLIYGVEPSAGNVQTMEFDGNSTFYGLVYAPQADISFGGGGNSTSTVNGSFTGKTVSMNGNVSIHYDERLSETGPIIDYRIASWFEDTR